MGTKEQDIMLLDNVIQTGYAALQSNEAKESAVASAALKEAWELLKKDVPMLHVEKLTGIPEARLTDSRALCAYLAFIESEHKSKALVY